MLQHCHLAANLLFGCFVANYFLYRVFISSLHEANGQAKPKKDSFFANEAFLLLIIQTVDSVFVGMARNMSKIS